jgi:glc operon protein GlcG
MQIRNAVVLAFAAAVASTSVLAQDMKPVLSLSTAKKIAEGCEAKATKEGWKMNIAIVDDGGNLKFFERQDDSFLVSIRVAQLKAGTSASLPLPSRKLADIAKAVPGIELVPGLVTFAGGLPIMKGGKQVGGIGVSGASADQDEACAQAGLDAAADLLK